MIFYEVEFLPKFKNNEEYMYHEKLRFCLEN